MKNKTTRIAVIGGDGTGPEVAREGLKVLKAVAELEKFKYELVDYDFGGERYLRTGEILPEGAVDELRTFDAIYLGAVGHPDVPPGVLEKGLLLELRFKLDQYINLRPVKLFPGVETPLKGKGPDDIDFVVVRENTEDLYCGVGGFLKKGTADEVASQTAVYTRKGCERCIRWAFDFTRRRNNPKKMLTLVAKTNVLTYGHDLWWRTFQDVAKDYPDVKTDYNHVDACCMWMVKNPEYYDVIVTTNMFGDIITDLAGILQGGMGVAAGGNINPEPGGTSMFEPMGGSAPKYTGQNVINPIAAINAMSMLLDTTGHTSAAGRVLDAIQVATGTKMKSQAAGKMGYSTQQVGDLVVEAYRVDGGNPVNRVTVSLQASAAHGVRRLTLPDGGTIAGDAQGMRRARDLAPYLNPVTLGLAPSFGFGDRIGLATAGHVAAMRQAGHDIQPIFAQQSIREMSRTGRTPQQVIDDAQFGMLEAGWSGPSGADADHLKTPQDVEATAAVGCTFFTLDPSAAVDPQADNYDDATLEARFRLIADEVAWLDRYRGTSIRLPTGTTIEFDRSTCLRAAVKYARAIRAAIDLGDHVRRVQEAAGRDFEIELSVDETPQPTTLAEHYIIARECLEHGMKLVSLAPRYLGDFEKGVDYRGDLAALEHSLVDHAAIATMLGPYKLSLHSGSDKLSMYGLFARATAGRFHVKTAGTSYLEALRVVARTDEALFRRIVDFSRGRYERDKATYHVSATLDSAPSAGDVRSIADLERAYLGLWADVPAGQGFANLGRQILHCTFGSVLMDQELAGLVRAQLIAHADMHANLLAEHFVRHLDALRSGMKETK